MAGRILKLQLRQTALCPEDYLKFVVNDEDRAVSEPSSNGVFADFSNHLLVGSC